ncbi:MAG TPA: DUF86 domain-containing protein [Methylophilaceae bacterium]|nr:DUF86 domain-containing protein [Methylophilaceae bacterium]
MSRSDQLRIPDYLDHVLVAIQRIFQYVEDMTEADFLEDEKTQDAVIRNFEVIGEASRNLERYHPDFVVRHPEVPWGDAYLLRNQIAHGYFKVDLEIVWRTIHHHLPGMEKDVRDILENL